MWKTLHIENNDFIIKKNCNDSCHNLLISNFVNVWGEEITTAEIHKRCKKFNPLMEGEEESVAQWVLSQINKETTATLKLIECEDVKVLEMSSKLAGVSFIFKFYLRILTSEKLYEELTLPLLLMLQQLDAQKQALMELLKKKDIEISEYKMEGAKLSRKYIETTEFNENQFNEMSVAIKIPDEAVTKPVSLFSTAVQNLYMQVVKKYKGKTLRVKRVVEQQSDTDGSEMLNSCDSSPEKKIKQNLNIEESLGATQSQIYKEENQTQHEDADEALAIKLQKKEEEKLLARKRKEAMKKKKLNL